MAARVSVLGAVVAELAEKVVLAGVAMGMLATPSGRDGFTGPLLPAQSQQSIDVVHSPVCLTRPGNALREKGQVLLALLGDTGMLSVPCPRIAVLRLLPLEFLQPSAFPCSLVRCFPMQCSLVWISG